MQYNEFSLALPEYALNISTQSRFTILLHASTGSSMGCQNCTNARRRYERLEHHHIRFHGDLFPPAKVPTVRRLGDRTS
jgi:hypothetical protein